MRRRVLAGLCACLVGGPARAAMANLDPAQSRLFRLWMLSIVGSQLARGPTPRWQHRDCAGLVRFSVAEALRAHDARWKHAMGLTHVPLPPESGLPPGIREQLRNRWRLADGTTSSYVGALELVQENTRFVAREWQAALPADLLFFDQGDEQHLMIWMGRRIAYHTGSVQPGDNGLRTVELKDLLAWTDTRWQPDQSNPNFGGIYRFSFLSDS